MKENANRFVQALTFPYCEDERRTVPRDIAEMEQLRLETVTVVLAMESRGIQAHVSVDILAYLRGKA